jgi:hypothetical protein
MIIRPKHYLLGIMGLLLAAFIYWVNRSLGNDIGPCLYLSFFTFLLWWFCWSLYFELRDFWQFRWYGNHVDHKNVQITPISIPILWEDTPKEKQLYGEVLHWANTNQNTPVVIFTHGFSDDSNYIRHYTIPIALSGFDVVAFDNRGTKKSRKAGKGNQFAEITHDLADVIKFVQNYDTLANRPIILVGISLGAVASLRQGLLLRNNGVKKVIAIAAIGILMMFYRHLLLFLRKNGGIGSDISFLAFQITPFRKLGIKSRHYCNFGD